MIISNRIELIICVLIATQLDIYTTQVNGPFGFLQFWQPAAQGLVKEAESMLNPLNALKLMQPESMVRTVQPIIQPILQAGMQTNLQSVAQPSLQQFMQLLQVQNGQQNVRPVQQQNRQSNVQPNVQASAQPDLMGMLAQLIGLEQPKPQESRARTETKPETPVETKPEVKPQAPQSVQTPQRNGTISKAQFDKSMKEAREKVQAQTKKMADMYAPAVNKSLHRAVGFDKEIYKSVTSLVGDVLKEAGDAAEKEVDQITMTNNNSTNT